MPGDWLERLTQTGGCGDVSMYASSELRDLALMFSVRDVVQRAYDQGGELTESYDLSPEGPAGLRLQRGVDVSLPLCNDVMEPGVVVWVEYTATAGTATLTVVPTGEPQPWERPALATLVLEDVVLFEPGEGEEVFLPRLELTDIVVGWFPG